MRTRVVAAFSNQWGIDVYHVHRFADFDSFGPKGERYCMTTRGLFWRHVQTFPILEVAERYARNLSIAESVPTERIEVEFENGEKTTANPGTAK